MSSFEPSVILAILKSLEPSLSQKKAVEVAWEKAVGITVKYHPTRTHPPIKKVQNHTEQWQKHRDVEAASDAQLRWEAEVVEYVISSAQDLFRHPISIFKNGRQQH